MTHWGPNLQFHWRSPFRPFWGSDSHLTPGSCVGRVGCLAVALGIGSATAAAFCGSCIARAEAEESYAGSAGPSTTSTSQSVNPGPRKTARTLGAGRPSVGDSAGSMPRGAASVVQGQETRGASVAPRASLALAERLPSANPYLVADPLGGNRIHLAPNGAPTNVTLPSVVPSVADWAVASTGISVADGAVPKVALLFNSVVTNIGPAVQRQAEPPVGIPTPSAATAALPAAVGNAIASLSVISDVVPTVPAEAVVATMAEAVRREKDTAVRTSRTSASKPAPSEPSAPAPAPAAAPAPAPTSAPVIEAERMTVTPSTVSRSVSDGTASGGRALELSGSGTASIVVTLSASTALTIRAKTNAGSTDMTLMVDGVEVTTVVVSSTSWADYTIAGALTDGSHVLSISSSDATPQSKLYLDKVTSRTGSVTDEFLGKSGSSPDGAIWTAKSGAGWDSGVQTYSPGNVYLDGKGNLVIEATKTKTGYNSGWVESKNKLSLGYGTITARIKVPKGQGIWPAFWLKGADEDTTAWPYSGEIDVLELPSTSTTVYNTLHGPISGSTRTQQAQIISTLPDLSTDYHNYWVRHLEDEITFGIDDRTLGTFTPASLEPGETWVYNRPMQVILNIAVGGPWAGAPDKSTRFPAKMLVDSVTWEPIRLV